MSIPRPDIDWEAYEQFVRANGGKKGTDAAFARTIPMDPNNFAQHKRRHYRPQSTPTNGTRPDAPPAETTALAIPTLAHPDASQRISALPAHSSASEVDDLKSRVAALESFIKAARDGYPSSASQRTDSASAHQSALERIHAVLSQLDTRLHIVEASIPPEPQAKAVPAHHIAPERAEPPTWVNRGMHVAADMLERIDTHAQKTRMEKREVLDLALRTFFAQVDGEGALNA